MSVLPDLVTRRRVGIALNILAIAAVLCFIFGNSLLDGQESGEMSSSVLDLVKPILRPIVDVLTKNPVTDALLHAVVRKLAHFTEFAGLASLSTLLLFQLCGTLRTHAVGYVLFGTLLAAVTDEFIQSFTGRGTSVRDALLDFCGALFGLLLTALICRLIRTFVSRKKGTQS